MIYKTKHYKVPCLCWDGIKYIYKNWKNIESDWLNIQNNFLLFSVLFAYMPILILVLLDNVS